MKFRQWYESSEPDLAYLLNPPGKVLQIGPETGTPVDNGIARYDSPHGSFRYVYYHDSQAVSVIQVVSRDASSAQVSNAFTIPDFRRQKFATQLLQQAKSDFGTIQYPPRDERSDLANRWIDDLQ